VRGKPSAALSTYAAYREDETFAFSPYDRFADEVYRRVPGNPEGY